MNIREKMKYSRASRRHLYSMIFGVVFLLSSLICIATVSLVVAASTGQQIADKARELAWGENEHSKSGSPTEAFTKTSKDVGTDGSNDCLTFVKTAIIASGADTDYPTASNVYETDLVNYMISSSKWVQIDTTNTADLQPGDILVSADAVNHQNHIFVYLGDGKVAAANLNDHYGRIENLSDEWWNGNRPFYYGDNQYKVFRIGSSSSDGKTPTSSRGIFGTNLTDAQYRMFAQSNIYFYSPVDCTSSSRFSSICGKTPKEKYWSFLRQHFDEVHAAAILGNIDNEGSYGPTRWEIGSNKVVLNDGGPFVRSWESLYNCQPCGVGVGALGITWNLGNYLHYINDNFPESLRYFQDAKYSYPGDKALELIGDADFNLLVETELTYMLEDSKGIHEEFNKISDVKEAAKYWAEQYERCDGCLASEGMTDTKISRMDDAVKDYNEMKSFSCTASSSNASGKDATETEVTLIGDSIAVMAEDELRAKLPNSYLTMVGSRHPVTGGACSGDKGGLEIVQDLVNESGSALVQHKGQSSCESLAIDGNSLEDHVVWELGTNMNGATKETIEKVIATLGNNRKLYLVTPFNWYGPNKGPTDAVAEMYRQVAKEHDNVYIVDWADAVKDNVEEYLIDEPDMVVHPTAEGAKLLASLIAGAISEAKNCTTFEGDYPEYVQFDPRWGGLPYANGTFQSSACGATSMATIATITSGQDVFPTDIANLLDTHKNDLGSERFYSSGYMRVLDPIVCEKYGCDVEVIEVGSASYNAEKIRQYLQDGWMIHVSGDCDDGTSSGHGPTCPYSRNGHYVAALALKGNDTAIVSDPGWDGLTEYKIADIAKGAGAITAIRANGQGGSSGPCSSNYCKTDTSSAYGGLTEEQAKKLADYYNGPKVDPSTLVLGRKENCVSFSVWFEKEFTKLTPYIDDGKEVAHGLAVQNNLIEGNEPRPFAVFGITRGITMCDDGNLCGHTGIVVGVEGDKIITVEAAYNSHDAWVITDHDRAYFENTKYATSFTYLDSYIDKAKLSAIVGSY